MFHAVVLYQCTNTVIRVVWFQISFRFCTARALKFQSHYVSSILTNCKPNISIAFATLLNVYISRSKQKTWLLVTLWKSSLVTGEWLMYSILRFSLVLCLFWWFISKLPCFSLPWSNFWCEIVKWQKYVFNS